MMYELIDVDLGINADQLKVVIPIVMTLIGFILFWFTYTSDRYHHHLKQKFGEDEASARLVITTKWLGGFTMGVLPFTVYLLFFPNTALADLGVHIPSKTLFATFVWTIGLGALMVFLVGRNAKLPENLEYYPQIRSRIWNRRLYLQNLLAWVIYLTGYEFLFRGLLFFPLVETMGLWPAIAVNIALYSGTHIPKGLKETVGAIPFAVILCLLTIQTGNIWIATIVHIAMAWTNDTVALKHHPDMVYKG